MGRASLVGRAMVVVGLAGAVLGGAPGASPVPFPVGAAPAAGCDQPHDPLYGFTWIGSDLASRRQVWPTHPVTAPDLTGTDLDFVRPRFLAGPDTDGDGVGDEVEIDLSSGEQVMVITRGDGVVRVGLAGSNLGDLTSRPPGDLDGDGRDEVLFLARPASGPDRVFVLPGATAIGSHQADDVAIEIPDYFVYGAGDQIGGAGDDLVVTVFPVAPATEGHSAIVSGDEIMAAGPGGAIDEYPASAPTLDGFPGGVFDLGGSRPAIATISGTVRRVVVNLWRDGAVTRFATAGPTVLTSLPWGVSAVRTATGNLLRTGTGDRGGGVTYVWDLDDPCRVLPADSTTTTTTPPGSGPMAPAAAAPAAAPVTAAARYTG